MDDFGSNLADDTSEMAAETAVNPASELRKRRSTRIVQAVPLEVTGVDALGRPFVERTSSLILNCHGCRFQSKHYVLKNMWVKLEVPNAEADKPPRTVRGRVAWIQRPRTVRQLFQVALELENPGNVWGIAFPPEDWFSTAEPEKAQAAAAGASSTSHSMSHVDLPLPPLTPPSVPQEGSETEFHVSLSESDLSPAPNPDNVRVFPSPASTTDASLQLARHVTRLLAEARQQIQAAAREAAAQAVSTERRATADQLERQIAEARESMSRELSGALERIQEEAQERTRAAHEAASAVLQDDLPKRVAPQLEELARQLSVQISEEGVAQRAEQAEQLTSVAETLSDVVQQAEAASERLRMSAEQAEAHLAARVEAVQRASDEAARKHEESLGAYHEALAASGSALQQNVSASLGTVQTKFQADLAGETEAAQSRWQIAVDNAFAAAQERAAGSVNERANALLSAFQQEAEGVSGTFRASAADVIEKADRQAQTVRELLQAQTERAEAASARAAETSERLEQLAARLETVQQHALTGFQSQADDVLNLHRNELHRHSELILEEAAGRIRSGFDESSRAAMERFGQQMESLMEPQISKATEAMQRLAGGRSLLDAALTLHQDRIRASTDESFGEALGQFRANLGSVEDLLKETSENITSHSLSDLELRVEKLKQQTVEDLNKSAEWYEKRAQTQTQNVAEKVSEQAASQLREKAGNISNELAGELDQSSRNFVAYAQTQMAEVVGEAFERARGLFAEAAETTSAAFIDEIQRSARRDLEGFEIELQRSAAESRDQIHAVHSELTQKVTTEQENFLRRFQEGMSGAVEAGVAEAGQRVKAGFEPLLDSWKAMTGAQQADMQTSYSKLGEQAAEHYRERLDNVSNQWMLATVTSFDHQSRDTLSRVAATAEHTLRETCTKVFADLGEALRERMQQIAGKLEFPAPSAPSANGKDHSQDS
jgi:hypothetical protein